MTTGDNHDTTDTPRLTLSQRLHEVTMAAITRKPSEPVCEGNAKRDGKGIHQIEVTVRGTDIETVGAALEAEYDRLCAKYPYPAANGGE